MPVKPEKSRINAWFETLPSQTKERLLHAVETICRIKSEGGKIIVVTGSGPNVHEGVTTLLAELMRVGVVDGITTSSAVVAHEMGGVLDRVKRVRGSALGIDPEWLPKGDVFEFTHLDPERLAWFAKEIPFDLEWYEKGLQAEGSTIIKAAGNLGFPVGLWLERISERIRDIARDKGTSFEAVAGEYADERTMIGQAAKRGLPVLVTIPQLVGGGAVGLAIGDSMTITQRARAIADLLDSADAIVESAVVLTQEIHDGPFETYTGHGLWATWQGLPTYRLEGKTLIRIDLDPALERAWEMERNSQTVQEAIDKGLPKTKLTSIPFRMEMSGFARLEGSVPLIGDIGVIWPILASRIEERLGLDLQWISAPQHTEEGKLMREWIADTIQPISHLVPAPSDFVHAD